MLAIRLPEEIEKRLEDLAQRTGRTKTFYAREAILEHLGDIEALHAPESIPPEETPPTKSPGLQSFTARWQGRFRPAERADERYRSLARKYL